MRANGVPDPLQAGAVDVHRQEIALRFRRAVAEHEELCAVGREGLGAETLPPRDLLQLRSVRLDREESVAVVVEEDMGAVR